MGHGKSLFAHVSAVDFTADLCFDCGGETFVDVTPPRIAFV